ncbi:MAG: selenium binding protein [Lachnospiraceae bacterium]|nr:selenium binding protein [Lachnospiraceae bacterium]
MYEKYTRQALPPKEYRELLGSALCVFNSNNAFVIENILRSDEGNNYNWYELMDCESGKLKEPLKNTITRKVGQSIAELFNELVYMRNRIIHSFQVTHEGEQILATKERIKDGNGQFKITEEYLLEFIAKNEKLSTELHKFRGF